MRKFTFIILALGAILVLPSLAMSAKELSEPEGILLNQTELEQLFENKCSYDYKNKKGRVFTITYYPNGTLEIFWKGRDKIVNDTGTYRILNGQLCNTWKNIRNGKEKCYKFYKANDNKYRTVSSDISWK